jgi:hypothetical protein
VANEASFSVEDFINAITTQLDRVQDALRVKAVNRPLTYALKDLQLELKVFVELDSAGTVRFRPAASNETGASAVQFAFTTITRPMIEENTISLASTRSAPLSDLGLSADEQQRLERVGVRNLAQLNALGASTGVKTISRLSHVPIDRLRTALTQGRPNVRDVKPDPPRGRPPGPAPPATTSPVPPVDTRPTRPPFSKPPLGRPPLGRQPLMPEAPAVSPPVRSPGRLGDVGAIRGEAPQRAALRIGADARRLAVIGSNFTESGATPVVSLNAQPLSVASLDDDRIVVDLPETHAGGTLEVAFDDGRVFAFDVETAEAARDPNDAWAPEEGA